jgi:DNA-binding IclR family transcriptional regulator
MVNMVASPQPQLVPAVDRAVRMLEALRYSERGRGISELARDLEIPKSSAYQIAVTLVHHGLLERDPATRRYRRGPALSRLSGSAGRSLVELAQPYLERLAARTRMTALLGVHDGDGVVLAAKQESPEPVGISAPLGHRLDGRAGVFGKLEAAALGAAELDAYLCRPLPAFTRRSITEADAFRKDVERVRSRGYALDIEEYLDGVVAVGGAVRDGRGRVVAGICLLGLAARRSRAELKAAGERLAVAAADLSRELVAQAADEAPPPGAGQPAGATEVTA